VQLDALYDVEYDPAAQTAQTLSVELVHAPMVYDPGAHGAVLHGLKPNVELMVYPGSYAPT
jgi:hypothetical protein